MTGEHLTDLELARLLVPGAPADTSAHADGCDHCRELLAQARSDAHRFETDVLPRTLPALRARPRGSWLAELLRPRFLVPFVACATAAIILLVVRADHQSATSAGEPGIGALADRQGRHQVGIKGAAAVRVFARRGSLVWQLADRGAVGPGDAIRFVVEPAGARHVLIVSRDGAGAHTIYHPFGGDRSAPLPRGNAIELEGSVVLDDVLGDEELYVFLTDKPLDLTKALDSVRPRAGSGLRAGPVPIVFRFTKQSPPPPPPEAP